MDHQSELEKTKYRNWVRGGLAYKYLKDGIESFVDDIVKQEHSRILREIKHKTGLTCNRCTIQTLKPLHKSEKDPVNAGKDICPKGQVRCNCLFRKKEKCRNNICDAIFEEILNSHGSTPPAPNWKNSNIQNWCSLPWEIAKCFINSPGYSDKVSASDTDVAGLLHILINNLNLQEHFSVNINGNDVFSEAIEGRNTIFHSPAMELEDYKVNKFIDNIIAILEDEKELKSKEDSKQAVVKLKQLKDRGFVITTHDEVEVCRDAMASINNSSRELNQMIHEAKNDIDEKQTNALKAFDDKSEKALADALDKLDQRSESQQQVMKQAIELLNEKIKQLELDTNDVKERLTDIEQKVDRLDEIRNIKHKHLEYLEQKQVFQEKLVTLYEDHYVKTWISPFKVQDKSVNINEVYVEPNMIVKEETDESERDINRYQDIFQSNGKTHKKIYITGDVGTGKSALGKMMISNWCKACKPLIDEDENVEQMRKFDFLFFIPLQRMSGYSYDIKEMIKTYYKDITSKELIERIVEQDGDRCLIICDGLDEWTPPRHTLLPHHISFGIPIGDGMRNATFITLSRPSAKGILNMKSTEFDKKIVLLGFKKVSKIEFTRKYMSKLGKNEDIFLNEFMQKIEISALQNLERTPFLLQQLIWMYCNGNRIGQSVSDIFSNILNIIFTWWESKDEEQTEDDSIKTPEEFKQMQLPKMLRRFPRCQTNERLLFLLSKFSFFALTDETIRSTFGRSELLRFGIKRTDIAMFLQLGILVECNSFDPTYEKTYFSFVHISYLEFFAAVYISSHCIEKQNVVETILEKLFMKIESAEEILQLSNLLEMVCGLSPFLTGEISKLISRTVRKDKGMIEYRKNLHQLHIRRSSSTLFSIPVPQYNSIKQSGYRAYQIESLMNRFLSESGPDGPNEISICDLFIIECETSLIRNYTPDDVISLRIDMGILPKENAILKAIAQFSQLESVCVYNIGLNTFHNNSRQTQLTLLLAQINENVENLSLIDNIHLRVCDLQPYIFDLSKYYQLQSIHLHNVWCILGSGVNNLKYFNFSTDPSSNITDQVKKQFSSSLTQTCKHAVFLTHLTLENKSSNAYGIFDLSKLSQLQSIKLHGVLCTLGSNVKNLETVYISATFRNVKQITHIFCKNLSSSLGKAVSLKQLYLERIQCNGRVCLGHDIDMSGHVQLQSITFVNCALIFDNAQGASNLENVKITRKLSSAKHITHGFCEHLSSSLGKAVSLKDLHVEGIRCKDAVCEGHTIDLSGHVQLQSIHLTGFLCKLGSDVKNVERVYISGNHVKQLTHGFCEQLSSSLGKAVSLKQLYLQGIQCNDTACEGHSIDLSGHVQLESIGFINCTFILNNAQSAKNLEKLGHIHKKPKGVDHVPERLFLESLSQAVSLTHLKLEYSDFCNSLTVDLSKFDHLQNVHFIGAFLVSGLSTQCLKNVSLNNYSDVGNLIYLCSGSRLEALAIGEIFTFRQEILASGTPSGIRSLKYLKSLILTDLHIDDENALTVSPIMQNINQITFREVTVSLQAWQKFVDSLLTLNQSVRVSFKYIRKVEENTFKQKALEYVRKNAPVLEVNEVSKNIFEEMFQFTKNA